MSSILLQGGTLLIHDAEDHVHPTQQDLLIQGNLIAKIGSDIEPSSDCTIIDCRNKIISPGLVNTHLHTWETQLRGRTGDGLLQDYFINGALQGYNYDPEDVFWGQLAGCLEQIDAGTTTIAESVHVMYSPDHAWNALNGTSCSGIRSMFGYQPSPRVQSWTPFRLAQDLLAEWTVSTFLDMAKGGPYADGRVNISLNFDALFLPKEVIMPLFEAAKKAGVTYFMSHYVNTCLLAPYFNADSTVPVLLDEWGLLDDSYLIIHATNLTKNDAATLRRTKAPISCCPTSEAGLAQGEPICFEDKWGLQGQCSIGIDVHNVVSSYMPSELRFALLHSRGNFNEKFIKEGNVPRKVNHTCEEAFNLGTIQGARALKMGNKIGSLAEGKIADICILDAMSPGMVCGAQYDPVASIILSSSLGDVDTVIIDGSIRKQHGKLLPVNLDQQPKRMPGMPTGQMKWHGVASELLKSCGKILDKIDANGHLAEAKEGALIALGVDLDNVVDSI